MRCLLRRGCMLPELCVRRGRRDELGRCAQRLLSSAKLHGVPIHHIKPGSRWKYFQREVGRPGLPAAGKVGPLKPSILVVLLCLGRPAWADETPQKDGRAPVVRGAGKIVEEGELAGREFAHDASQVGREAWEKAKKASAAAAEEVRRATREFWRDVLEEKARLRA